MGSRLVNVRLDDARLRKVRRLREKGLPLAELVRDAIDTKYGELAGPPAEHAADVVRRILETDPDPEGLPSRDYDVHDRQAARSAIRRRLKRPR
jgi:hypothetical protein